MPAPERALTREPEAPSLDPEALTELPDLVEALPVGVFTLDAEGVVLAWSAEAARLTGLPSEQVVGRPLSQLDQRGGEGFGRLQQELDGAARLERTCRLRGAEGQERALHVALRPAQVAGLTDARAGAVGTLAAVGTPRASGKRPRPARSPRQRLVGAGKALQEVARRIGLAAESDVTVLLTGESGTGKELAASAIHAASGRADRPFLTINCGAIPEALLESELFGHVRGAFTGAIRDKVGLFQAAEGGTLFLDEVAELSPLMQVKLLRALQEREIRRVGDERTIRFDARIVSATNRPLAQLVSAGAFREDFYYRIRVFEIQLPPLRDRVEDLPGLIDHFVSELRPVYGKEVVGVAPAVQEVLEAYPWPGNVRELRNAVEHAFVTVQGERIQLEDLPPEIAGHRPVTGPTTRTPLDRDRILAALRSTGGKRADAARELGVSRVTLWKRMRQLGVANDEFEGGA